MTNILSDLIAAKGWCVADGATGTNLFGRGLETGYPPELCTKVDPGRQIDRAYCFDI